MTTNNNSNNIFTSVPMGTWIVPWFPTNPYPETVEEEPKDKLDGCICTKCKQFSPYAIPNQDDKSFVCYGCRHGY